MVGEVCRGRQRNKRAPASVSQVDRWECHGVVSTCLMQPYPGTPGGHRPSLSPSLLSFIPPSSLSLSSDLASGFCSQVTFHLNPFFFFF